MAFKGRATLSLIFNILRNTSARTWYIVDVQQMLLSYEWCIQELKEEEAKEERNYQLFMILNTPSVLPCVINNAT